MLVARTMAKIFDANIKVRGVAGSFDATGDRVVNQLLTVIDGFKEYNNLFLIGTTNRLDLIDQALLRPGRLELQLRVDLPDENGRLQILQIHSAKIREKGFVSHDVKLETIALKTFGWSGAQLEAVVRTAFANAMERAAGEGLLFIKEENIKVFISDFEKVIEQFDNASQKSAVEWLEKCRRSWEISLDTLAGLSENEQLQKIVQIFEAARTFQNSFIILDDIEWLLKYDVVILEHATLLQVKDLGSAMELLDDIPIKELYNIIDMAATGIEEESSGRKEMDLESFMDLVKYMT
ncbi:hypothetical protein RJ639_005676, partial [Escallonia herrerae]